MVYLVTDLLPRLAPGSLTFSESFTLATLVTLYSGYAVVQYTHPVMTSVGSPVLNTAIFAPWLSLLAFTLTFSLLSVALSKKIAFYVSIVLVAGGVIVYYSQSEVFWRVISVLAYEANIKMICYLATTLLIGLFVLYDLTNEPQY